MESSDFEWMVEAFTLTAPWVIENDLNESKEIQEYLFSTGLTWSSGDREVLDYYDDNIHFEYGFDYGNKITGFLFWRNEKLHEMKRGKEKHNKYLWSEIKKFI